MSAICNVGPPFVDSHNWIFAQEMQESDTQTSQSYRTHKVVRATYAFFILKGMGATMALKSMSSETKRPKQTVRGPCQ